MLFFDFSGKFTLEEEELEEDVALEEVDEDVELEAAEELEVVASLGRSVELNIPGSESSASMSFNSVYSFIIFSDAAEV